MANNVFIKISTVSDSGDVEELLTEGASDLESIGSLEKPNHPEEALVLSVHHKMSVPRDDRTGLITGNARHQYIDVSKLIDRCSPLLANAMVTNAKLEVEIAYFRPDEQDGEPFYLMTLGNARITKIASRSPDYSDLSAEEKVPFEVVRFNFESIDWEHVKCATTSSHSAIG